jgi:outer membrane receptor protein involved in Fe transport
MANRRVGLVFANIIAGSILPMHYVPAAAEQIVEEVLVVGSRLRAESLEDAPVAVAVVDGEALDDLNLTELQDISQMAASINLNPGRSDSLSIRGIGAGGDTGFDQSVGIVIDDVPFSRGRWTTSGMFDVRSARRS